SGFGCLLLLILPGLWQRETMPFGNPNRTRFNLWLFSFWRAANQFGGCVEVFLAVNRKFSFLWPRKILERDIFALPNRQTFPQITFCQFKHSASSLSPPGASGLHPCPLP